MTSVSFDEDDSGPDYLPRVAENREIARRIVAVREARGRLTQEQFAKRLGTVSRGAVGNWERGQGVKRENLEAIALTFNVSFEWLASGRGAMDAASANGLEIPNALLGDKLPPGGKYIPLYGHAVGGRDGEFVLNGNKLDEILAPPSLSSVRGAYAVTVAGDSMEPRYYDGETVFVDPERRVRKGDFVVAQIQLEAEGPLLAYVKRFVKHTSSELVLSQFNPEKELSFPHVTVHSVHFIVMGGQAT